MTSNSDLRLRPERLWLVLGIIWTIAFTLSPFELSFAPNELSVRLGEAFRVGDSFTPLKAAGHLVSFFVVGILAASVWPKVWRDRRIGAALAIGVVACLLLELAQLLQVGRHARLTDLVVNTVAFGAGLWFSCRTETGQRLSRELRSLRAPHRFAQATVVGGALVLWYIIGLQAAFGALKMDWDRTFPLTVGNEIGDARPWLGKVRYIGIYGRALLEGDVRRLHDGLGSPQISDVRHACGLLAGYDFRRTATEKLQSQTELRDPNLDLIVPSNCSWSVTDGLTTSRFPIIRSAGSASALTDRIVSSGAFSVEAWVQPDNLRQIGPARLVSISSGPAIRNFTLGQAGTDLVFRVRNRVNSSNGTVHELAANNVLSMHLQHIVSTYDHGVSMVYRDGNYRSGIDLREPVFYSGFAGGPMARGALIALAVITISLPTRFLFATVLGSSAAIFATMLFTFVAGTLPYLISCLVVGGPFRFGFVGWFAVALLLVFPVGLMLISTEPTLPGENPQNLPAKGAKSALPLVGSL